MRGHERRGVVPYWERLSLERKELFILALVDFSNQYSLIKGVFWDGGGVYSFDCSSSVPVKQGVS